MEQFICGGLGPAGNRCKTHPGTFGYLSAAEVLYTSMVRLVWHDFGVGPDRPLPDVHITATDYVSPCGV